MDQEEHGVHAESERQEGDDLRGGRVEGDADECGEAEAGTHVHGDQQHAAQPQPGLGAHPVPPAVQSAHRVHNLNMETYYLGLLEVLMRLTMNAYPRKTFEKLNSEKLLMMF